MIGNSLTGYTHFTYSLERIVDKQLAAEVAGILQNIPKGASTQAGALCAHVQVKLAEARGGDRYLPRAVWDEVLRVFFSVIGCVTGEPLPVLIRVFQQESK